MRKRVLTPPDDILQTLLKTPFRPTSIFVNGKEIPYMRMEVPIEVDDLFAWTSAQSIYPKVLWEDTRDGIVVGIGKAYSQTEVPSYDEGVGPRFFGGRDFMPRKGKTWGEFPSSYYFLPLIELSKRNGQTFLAVNRVTETVGVHLKNEAPLFFSGNVISRFDSPSYPVWEREVEEVLRDIREGKLTKAVLSRLTQIEFDEEISPFALLEKMSGPSRFAFQLTQDQTFIGNSPELLYRRGLGSLESAAIAGTRPRGRTEEEDARLTDELLNCPKERHEFQVVKEMLHETLSVLCDTHHFEKCRVLKTEKVQHLSTGIRGTLNTQICDQKLIDAFHPTPAVGGFPREIALKEISQREQFDRGWYAAPVGWVSPDATHLMVAIRSALVEKNLLRLFSGTGIVEGSNPLREWEELEAKIAQVMTLL